MASILSQSVSSTQPINHLRFRLLAGIPLILGIALSFIGVAFDAQWHTDVGPDTFFTLPHAVWYSAIATAGLTSLFVVLYSTWSYQRGQSIFPEEQLTFIWPVFRAPMSFVITGIGSAMFLLMGVYDLTWHGTFGFDVTPISPPHQGLFFAVLLNMIGTIAVFGSASAKRSNGALIGLCAATAIALCYFPLFAYLSMLFPIPNGFSLTIAGFYTLAFLMVSSATGRVGAATLTGLFILLFRYLAWFVTPWATKVYSASIGLSIRDDPSQFPPLTEDIPLYAFAVGLLLDGLLFLCKRQNISVRLSVIGVSAITSLLIVLPVQFIWGSWDGLALSTWFAAPLLGALLGFTGWKLGAVLREGAR
jgi:hypothetical protein